MCERGEQTLRFEVELAQSGAIFYLPKHQADDEIAQAVKKAEEWLFARFENVEVVPDES